MSPPIFLRHPFRSPTLATLACRLALQGGAAITTGLLTTLPLITTAAENPAGFEDLPQEFVFDENAVLQTSDPIVQGQVLYVTTGFFLRMQHRVLMGDALRWDQATDELYATGRVVLTQPGIRISAESIGLRRLATNDAGKAVVDGKEVGLVPLVAEAWDARVRILMPGTNHIMRISASRLNLLPDRIILHDVQVDGGYGALLGFQTPLLVVGLRDDEAVDRKGIKRYVEDVLVTNPNFRILGIPFFWLPLVYRDFRLNYPWTRFEFGRTDRHGVYARGWVGIDLPNACPCHDADLRSRVTAQIDRAIAEHRLKTETDLTAAERAVLTAQLAGPAPLDPERDLPHWYDLHGRVEGRIDQHVKAGAGGGIQASWFHHDLGHGEFLWYDMPNETIYSPRGWAKALSKGPLTLGRVFGAQQYAEGDSPPSLATQSRQVIDAEHVFTFPGGAGYARWVELPDPDPVTPDLLDPRYLYSEQEHRPPQDRFRADYLREQVENRPLAQRGLTLAWSAPAVSVVGDTGMRAHPWSRETEREAGFQLDIPPVDLLGPIHLGGTAYGEQLRRDDEDLVLADAIWTQTEAQRLRYDGYLTASRWLGGLGVDTTAGIRGLFYHDALTTHHQRNWWDPVYGAYSHYYDLPGQQARQHDDFGSDKEIFRAEADQQYRSVPYAEGGLRLRFSGPWGDDQQYHHLFTPRCGFEMAGEPNGTVEGWQSFDFHDGGDVLISDTRYLTAGFSTSLAHGKRTVLSAAIDTRWGLRAEDRTWQRRLPVPEQYALNTAIVAYDNTIDAWLLAGTPTWPVAYRDDFSREFKRLYVAPSIDRLKEDVRRVVSGSALVDLDGRLDFNPSPALTFSGTVSYDALHDRFDSMAVTAEWIPHERAQFRYQAVYLPPRLELNAVKSTLNILLIATDPLLAIDTYDEVPEEWQHTLGGTLIGNRYRLDSEVYLRPRGAGIDGFKVTISRKLVDGTIGLTYEMVRDESGNITDHNVGVSVSLYGINVF